MTGQRSGRRGYRPEVTGAGTTELAAVVRRGRLVALAFAGLMVGGMVTATVITHGQNADPNQSPPGRLLLAVYGTPLILIGTYPLLWWRASRRPIAGLLLGRRRGLPVFLSPSPPMNTGTMFLFLAFLTSIRAIHALSAARVPVTAGVVVIDLLWAATTGTYQRTDPRRRGQPHPETDRDRAVAGDRVDRQPRAGRHRHREGSHR